MQQALFVGYIVLFAPKGWHDAPGEESVAHLLLKAVHRVVVAVSRLGGLNWLGLGHLGGQSNKSLNCLSVAGNVLEILHKGTV